VVRFNRFLPFRPMGGVRGRSAFHTAARDPTMVPPSCQQCIKRMTPPLDESSMQSSTVGDAASNVPVVGVSER